MTAPHDKLFGIKPGDRVRVTFEGVYRPGINGSFFAVAGAPYNTDASFHKDAVAATTFQIERIEPPLMPGDFVLVDRTTWKIVDIRQPSGSVHQAVVWNDEDGFAIYDASALERIA